MPLIRGFRLAAAAVIAAAWTYSPAADPGLLQLVHPDANAIVGLRLRSLAQAPNLQFQIEESERLGLPETTTPAWESIKQMLGSDPLRYFEEVVLAARVRSFDERTEPEHMLLLVSGPYDDGMIAEACEKAGGCEVDEYRGVTVRYVRGSQQKIADDPAWFVVFDSRYAAAGKRVDIENLLDRRAAGHPRALSPAMTEWLAAAGESEAWFAAQGPFDWSGQEDTSSVSPWPAWRAVAAALKDIVAKVEGALLTLSLQSGYSVALQLTAQGEQDVETLETDVRRGWDWVREQMGFNADPPGEPVERLTVSRDGRSLTATVHISQQEVKERIRRQLLERMERLKAQKGRPQDAHPQQPGPVETPDKQP